MGHLQGRSFACLTHETLTGQQEVLQPSDLLPYLLLQLQMRLLGFMLWVGVGFLGGETSDLARRGCGFLEWLILRIHSRLFLPRLADVLERREEQLERLRGFNALQESIPLALGLSLSFIISNQLLHKPLGQLPIQALSNNWRWFLLRREHLVNFFQIRIEGQLLKELSLGLQTDLSAFDGTLERKSRLVYSLSLSSMTGCIFISDLNILSGWIQAADICFQAKTYK